MENSDTTQFKAGYVNIFGNPNAGKSTLLNAMLGERLAIVTPKAQTTRVRMLGILNEPGYQMIFSDTPGIIEPKYALQETMMNAVKEALEDADIALYLAVPGEREAKNKELFEAIVQSEVPLIIAINKVDTIAQEEALAEAEYWKSTVPKAEIWLISALHGFNVIELKNRLLELLPVHPPYFDTDQLTDKSERFIVSEVIREKILLHYKEEIPYACEVVVEEFKEEENIIRIRAMIIVERETQKTIIIGKGGSALKRVGTDARLALEHFFMKKIYLELYVKVDPNWRFDTKKLKRYGYR
ncbi:GTPase Era [Thermaurantimonas aggregans]|uniref:GTPase Era n=1 Tax=Thermaurantimonas aggregans TaxID=2173829 RepID=A0A401XIM6_9FLAO|nr:GTPase Era [Thermaurantimonas aggregans]MCX8148818.1 GTPase Era [Thermaurantimonas aggregans]GCD76875.1 GTPase Era [Thermaurantimonas aggregans]